MKELARPTTNRELEEREAAGLWKAIGLVNKLSRDKHSVHGVRDFVLIHRTIFIDVVPEIAGRYREAGEDMRKLHHLTPPPGSQVVGAMVHFDRELRTRLQQIPPAPRTSRPAISSGFAWL